MVHGITVRHDLVTEHPHIVPWIFFPKIDCLDFLDGPVVKNLPAMQGT